MIENIIQDIKDNKNINAELLAIFDEVKVYLVGDTSINNLKSVVLEALLHIGEYAIDNCNYRNIDVAKKIVEPVVSYYKRYIDLEYEKYQKDHEWLDRKMQDDFNAHYKCKFVLAILEKESMIQGNISISDFNLFLDKLFTQVRYSLFRVHSFDEKQVNNFLDETIRLAFKILSVHYAEENMKRIDCYLENINEIEEKLPNGNKKIYINSGNQDNYVIGVFKNGKLVEGTKDVIDLCTGQLYELEIKDGKNTGKGKRITYEGVMICGELKGEKGKGRIIYPNGDIYIGEYIDCVRNGQGRFIDNFANVTEGNFVNGISEGKTKIYCGNYTCYYNLKNGRMLDEPGKIMFNDGSIYDCNFKDSRPLGEIKAFLPNGDIYEVDSIYDKKGTFIENKISDYIEQKKWCENFIKTPDLKENYFSISGIYEGIEDTCIGIATNNGIKEIVLLYKNGDIYMGQIANDKKEGYGRIIYNNGEIYVGGFKNDKRDGTGVFINSNGKIYIGSFKNDEIIQN